MWDETLTTADLHEMLIHEADMSRERRAAVIDKMAAARILQLALDSAQKQ
jgi:putative Holliday junction resolvase